MADESPTYGSIHLQFCSPQVHPVAREDHISADTLDHTVILRFLCSIPLGVQHPLHRHSHWCDHPHIVLQDTTLATPNLNLRGSIFFISLRPQINEASKNIFCSGVDAAVQLLLLWYQHVPAHPYCKRFINCPFTHGWFVRARSY